jgi:polar amino acid transport system substrate-binding protein
MSVGARQLISLALLATVGGTTTACASTSDQAMHTSLAALATSVVPPASSSASATAATCGDRTASLRPRGALPPPGQMPAGSYMRTIQQRGKLIAGVDQNTLLFAYFNPRDGQLEGLEIDILHQLAKAIFGNPDAIEFKASSTEQRLPFVEQGNVDLVADAVTITCERRTRVSFSTVYFDAGQRILVPQSSPARGAQDLAHKRVCVTRGSTSLTTLEHQASHASPYKVDQRTDCLVALQEGNVDAITSDDSILLGFKAQDPYTKIVGAPLADEPYGIAINKNHSDFVRFVNAVLERMRADGSWAATYRKWLGGVGRTPAPPTPHYGG